MKIEKIPLYLACYLFLFLLALLVAAIAWNSFANGVLYVCTDPVFDLYPPFVHAASDDKFLVSPWLVNALWGSFLVVALAAPAFILWAISRLAGPDPDEPKLAA